MTDDERTDDAVDAEPTATGESGPEPARGAEAPAPRRAVGAAVLRGFTGVLVVGLTVGVAYGAGLVAPEETTAAPATTVDLVPATTPLVCAGPTQLVTTDAATDPGFDPAPVGTTSLVTGAVLPPTTIADPVLRTLDEGTVGAPVAAGAGASVFGVAVASGTAVWSVPAADGSVHTAATASSVTAAGDLRGLAATGCQAPAIDHWLVAGGTEVGSSTRLVVQNPSRTPATVEIEVFGPAGRVDLAGPAILPVPAGGATTTLLEGVAAGQRRVAVHVRASGALVATHLQVSALDGVRPLGVDLVGAGAEPSTRQVLAGVVTPGSAVGDDGPVVRLLAPEQATTARLAIYGPAGRVLLPGADDATLEAGAVTDVSLAGLPAGSYDVLVESDAPVVAAASTRTPGTEGDDVATLTSQDPGTAPVQAAAALPSGLRPTVVLGAVPESVDAVPGALVAGLDATTPPASEDAAAAAGVRAQVVALDRAGNVVYDQVVELPAGATRDLPVGATLPGVDVASVLVREVDASGAPVAGATTRLLWSVRLTADAQDGTVDGLVASLSPTPLRSAGTEIILREGLRAGLD